MEPFSLSTERLVLDQPTAADIDRIALYCADPAFEKFMTTPWPYERRHAEYFVSDFVPIGWSSGGEWTWVIRERNGHDLLGAICVRMNSGSVGYWLGSPHRGRGIMPVALTAAMDAVFERTVRSEILWECVVGNVASMRVAQKVGFWFTGEAPGMIPSRDGSVARSWTGVLGRNDDRVFRDGWPS